MQIADHYYFALHHVACLVEVVILFDIVSSAMTIHTINTSIIQKTQHLELKLSAPSSTELVNVYNILAQVLSKNRLILAGKWKISIGIVRQNNIPNIVFILLFIVIIIIIIDVAMRVYL